jgi:hypothetical protein
MKFLLTYAQKPNAAPPTPEQMMALGKFTEENVRNGTVLMTGGLTRPTKGTHVRQAEGKFVVTDGPFAETKEVIDGFALVQAKSKDEAIEIARRFMKVAGDGDGEILQVYEPGDLQPNVKP